MFGSSILDVAIGLIFVYLLLSLICSALNELIESWLKNRAADLERGIRELLKDPQGQDLVKKLYDHPLIAGLFPGTYDPTRIVGGRYPSGSNLPSYIPSRNFALALMDIVLPAQSAVRSGATRAAAPAAAPQPLQELRDAAGLITNPEVRRALLTLIDAAGDDASRVRQNIEDWFDSAMDRVSGWYKRRVQYIILALAVAVTVITNADTLAVGNSLWRDQALRSSVVAAAQEFVKDHPEGPHGQTPEELSRHIHQIHELNLPMGWNRDDPRTVPPPDAGWGMKVLGWAITVLAIMLGAPFWFDVLNKIIVVRSTVKPREKSPPEPPVDR